MSDLAVRTCGVRVDPISLTAAVDRLCDAALRRQSTATHLVNAYTLSLALRDPGFAAVLDRGDLNLPDGVPLVWAGRRAGAAAMERVYGPDLMLATAQAGVARGLHHYLYGSTPEVIDAYARSLQARFPGIEIVGVESPPFRALTPPERSELVDRVRRSGANILWVGLGTPKQDQFVDEFRDLLDLPLVAVGAAFDFIAGTKGQAPTWMQERGLEWAYRLAKEPRRLWKRYLVGNAVFLVGLARGIEVVERPLPGSADG